MPSDLGKHVDAVEHMLLDELEHPPCVFGGDGALGRPRFEDRADIACRAETLEHPPAQALDDLVGAVLASVGPS